MTDPKFAQASTKGRTYTFRDTDPLISVTSVVGVMDKPALLPWACKMAGERAVKHESEWHAIQQEDGDEAARKWISAASREFTAYRQTLGSMVHWMVENRERLHDAEVQGKIDWWVSKTKKPYRDKIEADAKKHLTQFYRFMEDYKPEFVMQEVTVASLTHGYAGTLDAVVEMDGATRIMDIKTGGAYPTTALQLAAYRHAEYVAKADGTLREACELAGITHGFVLELKPQSYKVHHYRCGEDEFAAFCAALRLKRWADDETVIGDEFA